MSPILIHIRDNLHRSLLQTPLNLSPIPLRFGLTPRARQRDFYNPCLPNGLLVRFRDEPAFAAFALEELDQDLAAGGFGAVLRGGLIGGDV